MVLRIQIHQHRFSANKGFTLIELLLGLAIFALIALGVSATFWGGAKLSHRMEPMNNISREAQMTLSLMADEFENMVFYDFSNSYPDHSAFSGTESRATFLKDTTEGLKVVSYYLDVPENSRIHEVIIGNTYSKNVRVTTSDQQSSRIRYLIREETPLIDYLSNNTENRQREVVNRHVQENGLNFSYRYLADDARSWRSGWQQNDLPAMVRIEMDMISEDENQNTLTLVRDIYNPTGTFGQENL